MKNSKEKCDPKELQPSTADDVNVEEIVREQVKTAFSSLSVHARFFVGPIPPPEVLKQYAEISPDIPDRIVKMAENEQLERMKESSRKHDVFKRVFRWWNTVTVVAVLAAYAFLVLPATPHRVGWVFLLPIIADAFSRVIAHLRKRSDIGS